MSLFCDIMDSYKCSIDEKAFRFPFCSLFEKFSWKYLVQNCAGVNNAGNNGITALMYASLNGHIDCVKYLIQSSQYTKDLR